MSNGGIDLAQLEAALDRLQAEADEELRVRREQAQAANEAAHGRILNTEMQLAARQERFSNAKQQLEEERERALDIMSQALARFGIETSPTSRH